MAENRKLTGLTAPESVDRWVPAVAVGIALVFRAIYLLQIRGNPYFDVPLMDEGYHDLWAREIASGDWASRIPFFRAPLYPALLGLAYRLFVAMGMEGLARYSGPGVGIGVFLASYALPRAKEPDSKSGAAGKSGESA